MAVTYTVETPWDTAPDSSSDFIIYAPDDQWIMGNATDPNYKYDGEFFDELRGNPPKGSLFLVYKNRLMIAGNLDFPHRIFYSEQGNGEGWNVNTKWIDIYPEDGGKINGLEIRNDELVISKNNGRKYGWRIYDDGNPRNSRLRIIDDSTGNVAVKAQTSMNDIHYYFDDEGIFTLPREVGARPISFIVDEVVEAISSANKSDISMGSNNGLVHAAIGDVTFDADGSITLTDTALVFDVSEEAIYLRDNVAARVFSRFKASGENEELYYGDDTGKVFKLNSGTTFGVNNPITMIIRSKAYFKDLEENITVRKLGVFMKEPDGTKVTVRTREDEGFVQTLGEVTKSPIQWFDYNGQEAPFFQMQFTHSGTSARPLLMGWAIIYREASRDDAKDN